MEWYYIMTGLVLAILYFLLDVRERMNMPPSPRSIPFIGHLHLLRRALPHHALARLADKYGPIMFLKFGSIKVVVVSSGVIAKEFLKTHDLAFASRPKSAAAKLMGYGPLTMGFVEYGEHWRQVRKLCSLELFTQKRLQESQQLRSEEANLALISILKETYDAKPVDLHARLGTLSTNFITRLAFGKRFLGERCDDARATIFRQLIREEFFLFTVQTVGDCFPMLAWLDFQGYERRMKAAHKNMDQFLEQIIEEHIAGRSNISSKKHSNLLEILLSKEELDHQHVKAIVLDILSAGSDTSAVTVHWSISHLLKSPEKMKRLVEEMDKVVGKDKLVEEDDFVKLPYLQAVVKETLRLHPPPLMIPHESRENCKVLGYNIRKGTRLVVNAWLIGRDPKIWEDPNEFKPERFINNPLDITGQDFELIPFGSGRRICPGMPLGLLMVQIFLARFVQCFDWALPKGYSPKDLDMKESFGLVCTQANPIPLVPTPRLSLQLIMKSATSDGVSEIE